MTATYTKLKSGDWGVRATSPVKAGDRVSVTTKAGARKSEEVARVIWRGDGVWLCAIAPRQQSSSSPYERTYATREAAERGYFAGSAIQLSNGRWVAYDDQ